MKKTEEKGQEETLNVHPTTKKRYDLEMEAISLTLNISANSWSNLVSKDSFENSSS